MSRWVSWFVIATAACGCGSGPASPPDAAGVPASPVGALDDTFGVGGFADRTVVDEQITALAALRGGGFAALVDRYPAGGSLTSTLLVYRDDGTLDTSINSGEATLGGFRHLDNVLATAGDTITVVGDCGGNHTCVARVARDGTLDPTYGNDGVATLDVAGVTFYRPSTVDAAGRVLVADSNTCRLTADGQLDPTFGTQGCSSAAHGFDALVVAPSGRIIYVGCPTGGLCAQTDSGAVDTTFGGGDGASPPLVGSTTGGVVIAASGDVVVGASDSGAVLLVVAHTPDGARDPDFGSWGRVELIGNSARGLAALADGRVAAVGPNGSEGVVYWLAPDGTPLDVSEMPHVTWTNASLDPAGRVLVAGYRRSAADNAVLGVRFARYDVLP